MQKKTKKNALRKHASSRQTKLLHIAIHKLLDGGGSPTDMLLLDYILSLWPPPATVARLLAHADVKVRLDRARHLFVLNNLQGKAVAECICGDDDLIRLYLAVLAEYAKDGGRYSYRLAQWVLRPPANETHAAVKRASLELYAEGILTVVGWNEQYDEPLLALKNTDPEA